MLFNLLSLWQTAARPGQTYRRPASLRTAVFLCGAIAGTYGRTPVINLSRAWGGLEQRIPLIQNTSRFCRAIPPRLPPPTKPPFAKTTAFSLRKPHRFEVKTWNPGCV